MNECGNQYRKLVALILGMLMLLVGVFYGTPSYGQSREILQYQYDGAGNIVGVRKDLLQSAPTVSSVNPQVLRIGPATSVVIEGQNLAGAQLSSDDEALRIGELSSTGTQINVVLTATENTRPGLHQITVATSLGSTDFTIEVEPRLPELLVSPLPMVVAEGSSIPLQFTLSGDDVRAQTFSLSVDDPSVISVSRSEASIEQGQRRFAPILVSGLSVGATTITVNSSAYDTFRLTVRVNENNFVASEGDQRVFSSSLGVLMPSAPQPPDIVPRGPFLTELRVRRDRSDVPDSGDVISPIVSSILSLVNGRAITGISPQSVIANSQEVEVTVEGVGLSGADSVDISPSEGVSITGLTVASDGRSARFLLSVDQGVALGLRRLQVFANGELIQSLNPLADRFYVGGQLPVIESIDPVTINRGADIALILRGRHFEQARSISITPNDDLTIGSGAVVNTQGTEASTQLQIGTGAELGARVVTIMTPTGRSSLTLEPANQLTITARAGERITPIQASSLGVVKGNAPEDEAVATARYSIPVGIVKGSVITGLQPSARSIGSTFTLAIEGAGLQGVDSVRFTPDTGLSVGEPTVEPSGGLVMVNVTIAGDAPTTLREVQLLQNGQVINPATSENNRFRVTRPQPLINSIAPNFLLANNQVQTLLIRGERLNDLQSVRIEPAQGITLNTPQSNSDGSEISIEVTVNDTAVRGDRTVIVETLGGTTDTSAVASNQITIASDIRSVVNSIVAPVLGISRVVTEPQPSPIERSVNAPLIGITKEQSVAPVTRELSFRANNIGLVVGSAISSLSPQAASIDTTVNLVINGSGLGDVNRVSIEPDTGLTLGTLIVSDNQLSLPVTVAVDAPQTGRRIIVASESSSIPFSNPAQAQLQIAGPPATIESIEPIQQTPGANFVLLVRGTNLQTAQTVTMLPIDSRISLGIPEVNTAGTELRVQVNLSETVNAGVRTVVVTTLAGPTSDIPTPANSFNVVDQ